MSDQAQKAGEGMALKLWLVKFRGRDAGMIYAPTRSAARYRAAREIADRSDEYGSPANRALSIAWHSCEYARRVPPKGQDDV